METPFIAGYISRSILRGGQIPKSSRRRNHLARQAFNQAGYNRFPARAKLHNGDQPNSEFAGKPQAHAADALVNKNTPRHRKVNPKWGTNE
jgi:hypothetical protein